MVKKQSNELKKIQELNKQLKAENASLKKTVSKRSSMGWIGSKWRVFGAISLVGLAGALLLVCNVLFWAGRTTLETDSYKQVSSEIIKDPEIGSAIALYTTRQIFQNNDVSGTIQSVLPPRAEFLAEPLSTRLEDYTEKTIAGILSQPKFQEKWIEVNGKVHATIIKLANSPEGQDGVISLNEAYQALSASLIGTKLSFLANKSLPANVGQITILESEKLRVIHVLSSNLNSFKYVSLALIIISSVTCVWLVNNRRRMVIVIGLIFSSLMIISLLGLRVVSTAVSSSVQSEYQVAVKHAVDIVSRPLVLQSYSILLLSLLAAGIAYIGSNSKSATLVRSKFQLFLEGKAHRALFSKENKLTFLVGQYRRALRVFILLVLAAYGLTIRLTPMAILVLVLVGLGFLVLVELLASPKKNKS